MPYIKKDQRLKIYNPDAGTIDLNEVENPGQLNYAITKAVQDYLGLSVGDMSIVDVSYAEYNEVIGVLECVKQEFYRRAVSSYEDLKRSENGDVFFENE